VQGATKFQRNRKTATSWEATSSNKGFVVAIGTEEARKREEKNVKKMSVA